MPSNPQNIIYILQQRQRGSKVHFSTVVELQKIAEEKAALAEMQEIHCKLPNSARSTFLTSFSPDSTKVASTHGDHKIYVCDVKTGKLLHKLEGHPRTPWCLAFHPTSNDILASGCLGGEVRVWHLHGGSEKWRAYHSTVITSLAFHPLDKVLVIATFNEIHFWDWSLPEPFASCSTSSVNEKVRFVKFDRLGNKLITGISNLPESYRSSTSSAFNESAPQSQSRTSSEQLPGPSSLSYRRSLLTRLMSMYQHIEGLDEVSRLSEGTGRPSSPAQEEALNQARHYAEATTQASRLQRQIRDHDLAEQLQSSSNYNPLNAPFFDDGPTLEQRELLDSHEEFLVRAFWRTFHRLRSICTTLERRMYQLQRNTEQQQQPSLPESQPSNSPSTTAAPAANQMSNLTEPVLDRIRSASNDVASNTRASYRQVTSNYLINVLTRLQNSLQFSSLSNAVAQEQIQQLQFRISEILERLTNVTGYRARLTTLRDQIFEVAERAERRGGDASSIRRLDLAHCLWLVEMSLQLTQQMQRILHADYRLTQLHINSSSRRAAPSNTVEQQQQQPTATSQSNTPNSSRNCAVCGTQPAVDAGSSEEFDQAWDRLRVVVRRELETLTERFRGNSFNETNRSPSRNNENETRAPTSIQSQSNTDNLPSSSSAWRPVLIPLSENPTVQRLFNVARSTQDQAPSDNDDSESSDRPRRLDASEPEGHRLLSVFNNYRSWHRITRRGGASSTNRNSGSSSSSSTPASSQSGAGPPSILFVPEIHVVPSSSDDAEPSVLLPVQERPRSPPLPTILSGSNDPLLSTWFQAMYDAGTRTRFAETTSNFLHRIQSWDFSKYDIPSINNAKANVVVRRCKIHNDASVDISKDGEMLVALLPSSSSITADSLLFAVFSLRPQTLGQILLVSNFDSNAISVSFSPLSQYIVIGMATPRLYLATNDKQAVAQIFELKYHGKTLVSSHVRSLTQDAVSGVHHPSVSLNSVQWLPQPGQGLIYGTNRGCLCICKPIAPMNGKVTKILKNTGQYPPGHLSLGIRQRQYGTLLPHRMFSASTQTVEPETQTTGTQTFGGEGSNNTAR